MFLTLECKQADQLIWQKERTSFKCDGPKCERERQWRECNEKNHNPCRFRFIVFDSIKFSTSISMIKSRFFFFFTHSTILLRNHDSFRTQPHSLSFSLSLFHSDYEDILATSNLSLMTLTATDVLLALYSFFFHHSREWVFNQDESFSLAFLRLTWL